MPKRSAAALFVGIFVGCAPKIVDIAHEAHHHFVYKSAQVIAWDVQVSPHTATLMHEHQRDYLYVTLGPAKITSTPYQGESTHLDLHDGQIRYTKGPLIHVASNDGPLMFHNVTIELTQPATNVTPCDSPCVYRSDQWTAYSMTLAPGRQVDTKDALVVAVSDIDLTHGREQPLLGGPGQVGDTHTALTNAGRNDARFVMLEFK